MDEFGLDLDEVMQVIDSADVLIVRFNIVEKRLLMDARYSAHEGPLLMLVPRVNSVEERFRNLRQIRPNFPLPERIMSFVWPRNVETMRTSGVWQRIVDRLSRSGFPGIEQQCEEVYQQLLKGERAEVLAAIRGGEGYHSLWERKKD